MTSPTCEHGQVLLDTHVESLATGTARWLGVRLRVKCSTCNELFSWRGLNSGLANPDEPVVSADGYELRAPIMPGPGGVVGVLKLAGLESELKAPAAEPS